MIINIKSLIISLLTLMVLVCSGCAVVYITEDLENPFVVTLMWNGEPLLVDPDTGELPVQIMNEGGAVVNAIITDEGGEPLVPETYEWYLNGELILEDGDSIVLGNNMTIGSYWLDLIVGKGQILSSEQVQFIKFE